MGGPFDLKAMLSAREGLRKFLTDAERRYPINNRKLAALGFSQGG
jgi:predicted esterase